MVDYGQQTLESETTDKGELFTKSIEKFGSV